MSITDSAPTATPTAPSAPPHTFLEDVLGLAIGLFLASLGLFLLHEVGAVTGGTAGLSLLLSYAMSVPFGVLFIVINLPFFVLALLQKGWAFTARSLAAVVVVALVTPLHGRWLGVASIDEVYAVVAGNVLAGMGLLALFRHGASLGGFSALAFIVQERLGWRAGYVQMTLDVLVVGAALVVVEPDVVVRSALGAVVLNLVLAFNHRPGRYMGL